MNFSIAYHPQTYGQTERVNQVLDDMLRMYVMNRTSKWEDYFHLLKFAYNNGKQATMGMSLFKALYGKKCITLVNWDDSVNRVILGPKIPKEMEHEIVKIRQNLKTSQDRKKIYADLKRSRKEFKVRDHVYLQVNIKKSSLKLKICAKLELRYCGSFEVLDIIGKVAYIIAFHVNMGAHNVFHVSLLKK